MKAAVLNRCLPILFTSAFAMATSISSAADNFRPGDTWLDDHGVAINAHGGGILFHDGTYYWFGEHKVAGEIGNTAQVGVHVYHSADLLHWSDAGIALAVSDDPNSDITKGCILERPKVIYNARTKQFVMWFHLELKDKGYSAARAGVAVADSPAGPYRYVSSSRMNAGVWPTDVTENDKKPAKHNGLQRDFAGGQMSRDMTLFVDDDGSAYQITSSEDNQTLHISRLSDDYLTTSGQYARAFRGAAREAPAVFKRGDKYYLITSACTGWAPNAADVAVAPSIWGPWKSLGNPCIGTKQQQARTFDSQSTYVLPVAGKPDAFIFMADRWKPSNAIDGRYVWLPIRFEGDKPTIHWQDAWNLGAFDAK